MIDYLDQLISPDFAAVLGRALAIAAIGLALAWAARAIVGRALAGLSAERAVLAKRLVFYIIAGAAVASALTELGFDLTLLAGAAGILTVAIGFASQTSASNVISGIFLIAERPFSVGDWIEIGTTTGEVIAIDLLSVKLRTPDNLFVRVPNETVMKAEIKNLSRFPIRRLDLVIQVPFEADLDEVRRLLMRLADNHPRVLDEPRPFIRFTSYGESGVELLVAFWLVREEFLDLRDELATQVKEELDAHGIPMPVPRRRIVIERE